MAVTTTPRIGLTRWSAGSDPFSRAQMDASHAAVEANAVIYTVDGLLSARPAAGKSGRMYRATDVDGGSLFWDTGSAWVALKPDLSAYATNASVTSGLEGKANTAHTHAAADVTSGVFDIARVPVAASGVSNTTQVVRADDSRLSNSRVPTGTAGGDLAGSYPNPTIGSGRVTFAMLASAAVAASGVSSSTALVRADDSRLSNARTPVAHTHVLSDLPEAWVKQSVRAASTGNVTIPPGGTALSMDGITLANNDRVLLKDQTTSSQNGIYVVGGVGSSVTLTRAAGSNTASEVAGSTVSIDQGTQGGRIYTTIFKSTDTLGTTAMPWYRVTDEQIMAPNGGTAAGTWVQANDSRLSNSRTPTGSAGGSLTGTYPNPSIASGAVTFAMLAGAAVAASGVSSATALVRADDGRLSDSRTPTGTAGGDLTGTYPNPTIAALAVTDAKVAAANKDGLTTVPSLRTLGTGAQQAAAGNHLHDDRYFTEAEADGRFANIGRSIIAGNGLTGGGTLSADRTLTVGAGTGISVAATSVSVVYGTTAGTAAQGNDARLSDSRTPTGTAGGSLTGTYPNPTVASGAVTFAMLASAAVAASGTSSATAVVRADDSRLSNARTPTGAAGGHLSGTYPNPTVVNDSHTHDGRYFTETESDARFARLFTRPVFQLNTAATDYTSATAEVRNDTGLPSIAFHKASTFAPQLRAATAQLFQFVNQAGDNVIDLQVANLRADASVLQNGFPIGGSERGAGGSSGDYVRVCTIDGISGSSGGSATFTVSGGDFGQMARNVWLVTAGQRGSDTVQLQIERLAGSNTVEPVFYTKRISAFVFEVWMRRPTFDAAMRFQPWALHSATWQVDSDTTTQPAGLTAWSNTLTSAMIYPNAFELMGAM